MPSTCRRRRQLMWLLSKGNRPCGRPALHSEVLRATRVQQDGLLAWGLHDSSSTQMDRCPVAGVSSRSGTRRPTLRHGSKAPEPLHGTDRAQQRLHPVDHSDAGRRNRSANDGGVDSRSGRGLPDDYRPSRLDFVTDTSSRRFPRAPRGAAANLPPLVVAPGLPAQRPPDAEQQHRRGVMAVDWPVRSSSG